MAKYYGKSTHFSWVNQRFLWPGSIAMLEKTLISLVVDGFLGQVLDQHQNIGQSTYEDGGKWSKMLVKCVS